jgi:hypothetical protein
MSAGELEEKLKRFEKMHTSLYTDRNAAGMSEL